MNLPVPVAPAPRRPWHPYFRRALCATVFVLLAINLGLGHKAYSQATGKEPQDSGYGSIGLFMQIVQVVRQNYVDADRVSYEILIRGALKGMLQELDPFSSYLEPRPYAEMIADTEGRQFGGIGIHLAVRNGILTVIAPMDDSPAFKAGIKPGDILLEIEGRATSTMSFDDCVGLLKGEPGTSMRIVIYREAEDLTQELTLTRMTLEVRTLKSTMIPGTRIGYLRITQFNLPTAKELDEAIAKLTVAGFDALVLDLRDNPGGLLSSAVEVCTRFLAAGELVVSTEGRSQDSQQQFSAGSSTKTLLPPLAILVNGNSASAAEIVAGCLQDHQRAILVGETTFGKGSVQTVMPLPNQSALRLTTAHYYTPRKRIIHERGIDPDVVVALSPREASALVNQRVAYPGIVMPEIEDAVRDSQLERAIEVLKGVMLFARAQGNGS